MKPTLSPDQIRLERTLCEGRVEYAGFDDESGELYLRFKLRHNEICADVDQVKMAQRIQFVLDDPAARIIWPGLRTYTVAIENPAPYDIQDDWRAWKSQTAKTLASGGRFKS